jgi:hypothetical protein
MKKRNLLVMLVLVVAMSLPMVVPASACEEGCTPGYWRQEHHFDSWVGYAPDDYFDDVFGVGPHMTLLDALWARGGGENAFLRHAVAALLNAARPDLDYNPEWNIINHVHWAYGPPTRFEHVKNIFEGWNELGCPLN